MKRKVLQQNFFNRPTLVVARNLIGKFLVRRIGNHEMAAQILEVEAYDGPNDMASHAHKGETPRNKVMFGKAGYWYVYFVYGMHFMLNIVTGPERYPAAILIRAVENVSGPARLTKVFKIGRDLNGKEALPNLGLWIEDRGISIPFRAIKKTPRIGVAYAGPIWSKKRYRFLFEPTVSK